MDLSIEEFNTIGERTPLLANLKPHGKVYLKAVFCVPVYCLCLLFIVSHARSTQDGWIAGMYRALVVETCLTDTMLLIGSHEGTVERWFNPRRLFNSYWQNSS